jgi:hypothetical protein
VNFVERIIKGCGAYKQQEEER